MDENSDVVNLMADRSESKGHEVAAKVQLVGSQEDSLIVQTLGKEDKEQKKDTSDHALAFREAITTQRFSARVDGKPYLVRVLLRADGSTLVRFFNPKKGTVRSRLLRKDWLESLTVEARQEFLMENCFFRTNVAKLFEKSEEVNFTNDTIIPSFERIPPKPARRPPPMPPVSDINMEDEIVLTPGSTATVASQEPQQQLQIDARVRELEEMLKSKEAEIDRLMSEGASTPPEIASPALEENRERVGFGLNPARETVCSDVQTEPDAEFLALQKEHEALKKEAERLRSGQGSTSEKVEAEIAQLKIKLMDAESGKQNLAKELEITRSELEATIEECEIMVKEAHDQKNGVFHDAKQYETQLREEQGRTRLLTEQLDLVRALQEEEAGKARAALASAETKESTINDLQAKMNTVTSSAMSEKEAYKEQIIKLEKELETMTKSKDDHKSYGIELKSRITALHTKNKSELAQAQATIDALQASEKALKEQTAILSRDLEEHMQNAAREKEEASELAKELASHGHELELVRTREADLANRLESCEAEREKLAIECTSLIQERKTRIAEFEAQVHKRHTQHEEEVARLKVQIFDAKENAAAKTSESKELEGYVNTLLDTQDKLMAVLCSECKVKAEAASALR